MIVHMIRERTGAKPAAGFARHTLYALCGVSIAVAPDGSSGPGVFSWADGHEAFTVWPAPITCEACLANMRSRQQIQP